MRRNATLVIVDGVPRQHQRETVSFTRYSTTKTADRWATKQQVALLSLSPSLSIFDNLSDERFALAHQCGRARGMRAHTQTVTSYKHV